MMRPPSQSPLAEFTAAFALNNERLLFQLIRKYRHSHQALHENLFNMPVNKDGDTFLIAAMRTGNFNLVNEIETLPGVNVNAQNNTGMNAVMMGLRFARKDLVMHLLRKRPDIDFSQKTLDGKDVYQIYDQHMRANDGSFGEIIRKCEALARQRFPRANVLVQPEPIAAPLVPPSLADTSVQPVAGSGLLASALPTQAAQVNSNAVTQNPTLMCSDLPQQASAETAPTINAAAMPKLDAAPEAATIMSAAMPKQDEGTATTANALSFMPDALLAQIATDEKLTGDTATALSSAQPTISVVADKETHEHEKCSPPSFALSAVEKPVATVAKPAAVDAPKSFSDRLAALAEKGFIIEIPEAFVDQVTFTIMNDPVTLPSGHTFDRTTLQDHCDRKMFACPISRREFKEDVLQFGTNVSLKNLIEKFVIKQERKFRENQVRVSQSNVGLFPPVAANAKPAEKTLERETPKP